MGYCTNNNLLYLFVEDLFSKKLILEPGTVPKNYEYSFKHCWSPSHYDFKLLNKLQRNEEKRRQGTTSMPNWTKFLSGESSSVWEISVLHCQEKINGVQTITWILFFLFIQGRVSRLDHIQLHQLTSYLIQHTLNGHPLKKNNNIKKSLILLSTDNHDSFAKFLQYFYSYHVATTYAIPT